MGTCIRLAPCTLMLVAVMVAGNVETFAQPERTPAATPTESGPRVGPPPGVPEPFYPHGMESPAPPTAEDWKKLAQQKFDEWTREKKAGDCNCSYTHAVIGPTTVSTARWKPPTPQWKSVTGTTVAELNHELPNGRFIGLPAINPVTRVYFFRKGTLEITDYRVFTLEISVRCTGKDPECPKPQILKYPYETDTAHREVESVEGCYASGLTATGGASINQNEVKRELEKINSTNLSDVPNPGFVSPSIKQPPEDTPIKPCL